MSKELLTVLITALASLLVSIIALLSARLASKSNAEAQKELERQRNSFATAAAATSIADKEFEAAVASLKQGIEALQRVKDEIQLMLNSIPGSLPEQAMMERVKQCRDHLSQTYEQSSAHLRTDEDRALHTAKNSVIGLWRTLQAEPLRYDTDALLSANQGTSLLSVRAQLSDAQQVLRDRRTERLEARILGKPSASQ